MNNTIELYDSIPVAIEKETSGSPVTREMERGGMWLALAGGAVIGLWAVICLVGGLCSCGGFAMIKSSLFMALTGM